MPYCMRQSTAKAPALDGRLKKSGKKASAANSTQLRLLSPGLLSILQVGRVSPPHVHFLHQIFLMACDLLTYLFLAKVDTHPDVVKTIYGSKIY